MNRTVKKQNQPRNNSSEGGDIPKPLHEHLNELRTRGIVVITVFVLLSIVGYLLREYLISILIQPLHGPLYYTTPSGGLEVNLKVSFLFGAILTVPVFLYQIIAFIQPLLPKMFMKRVPILLISSFTLLLLGVLFAYFILLPSSLRFLTMFGSDQIKSLITTDNYMSFLTRYILGFAFIFQLPLVLILINSLFKVSARTLFSLSRFIILISFIVAAFLTPTPDIINQSLLALPIITLYLCTTLVISIINKRSNTRSSLDNL